MQKSHICTLTSVILLLSMLAGCSMQKCTICHSYGATHKMYDDILCDDCYTKIQDMMEKKETQPEATKPPKNTEKEAEEEAAGIIGAYAVVSTDGNFKTPEGTYGKQIEDLCKAFPDNEIIQSYNHLASAIYWYEEMQDYSPEDDLYTTWAAYMEDAALQVDISILPSFSDFATEFISTAIGMDRYNELAPQMKEKQKNGSTLTREDKINILVDVFSQQDALGENATDEQVEELWKQACEKYNISMEFLMELFLDKDLPKQAYIRIENAGKTERKQDKKEPVSQVPREYKSALIKAESYGSMMHMSKAAIYDQLVSEYGEQFSPEAAQYAVDNVVMDWNENALVKAESYSNSMYMSKKAIYDQLTSAYGEQFTAEEAQYAIDHMTADWKYNALQKAISYQDLMAMSPSAIYDQLVSPYGEQFTAEEAQYAIDNMNK